MRASPLLLLLVAALLGGCATAPAGRFPPRPGEPTVPVWLVESGLHVGLVVPLADVPPGVWPEADALRPRRFLEVGWGEEDFYMHESPGTLHAIAAILLPNRAVLHLVAFDEEPVRLDRAVSVLKLVLGREGFGHLVAHVAASHRRGPDAGRGKTGPLGAGFYAAYGVYWGLNTCNNWTARALQAGGVPQAPLRAPTAGLLLAQAAPYGHWLRPRPRAHPAGEQFAPKTKIIEALRVSP